MSSFFPLNANAEVPGDHLQRRNLRQRVDDLFCQPVAEVLVVRLTAHIGEPQHRNRRSMVRSCGVSRFQVLQRRFQIGHRLKAERRLLGEASLHDLRSRRVQRRRILAHDRVQRVEQRFPFEHTPARDQFVEDRAEAEDVRAGINRDALRLFGGHVGRRAEHRSGDRPGGVVGGVGRHLRQPEVEQLRAAARHHDIGRFQIAMENPLGVCRFQRLHDVGGDAQCFIETQRPAEWRAFDVLHHEVIGTDVVKDADMRMIQSGNGARLLLEALAMPAG